MLTMRFRTCNRRVTMTVCARPWSAACYRTPIARPASVPPDRGPLRPELAAPDRRLAAVHARYTAAVDLDVEFLWRSLKLDPETVSDRVKSDDLDLADWEV